MVDLVANQRLNARMEQTFYQIRTTNLAAKAQASTSRLPCCRPHRVRAEGQRPTRCTRHCPRPDQGPGADQRKFDWSSATRLCRPAGVRSVAASMRPTPPTSLVVTLPTWSAWLQRLGLQGYVAQRFVEQSPFRGQPDLYDNPLPCRRRLLRHLCAGSRTEPSRACLRHRHACAKLKPKVRFEKRSEI